MRYRLRHLDLDDKMCQHVNLEIVAQIYPQKLICEQLSLHDAWEERERALNMVVVIHLLLAASKWTLAASPRVPHAPVTIVLFDTPAAANTNRDRGAPSRQRGSRCHTVP